MKWKETFGEEEAFWQSGMCECECERECECDCDCECECECERGMDYG